MSATISALQEARADYQPRLPLALRDANAGIELGAPTEPATDRDALKKLFPKTYGQPQAKIVQGKGGLSTAPLKVGVVLSGGQAPGGHNVIAGLFDALKAANADSRLYGFLKGPGGVIEGKYTELTAEFLEPFRNTGGFDMIMSGRDKIEKPAELAACQRNLAELALDGLIVIGGDDSNTNAAVLAEYLKAQGSPTCVVGVPKTIDGDMKNEQIEASFGFDTAAKTYSELIGSICRDATSAVKHWHFVKLMGRAASHIALECALQTHPNLTLVSEEIEANSASLQEIVDGIVDIVLQRAAAGRNYGVLLVPEGLVEFIPEFRKLIDELGTVLGDEEEYLLGLPDHSERFQYLMTRLTAESARLYGFLPESIQEVLLKRDSHDNLLVSQIETERLLMDLVSDKIRALNAHYEAKGEGEIRFNCLGHFFGYEGRCAFPSNFDADYCYSLGHAAAQLVRGKLTGYTANVQNLTKPADEWLAGGTPVTMMLNLERRKGAPKPVIRKALVDLNGRPFQMFAAQRDAWALNDDYVFPGAIQYFGPAEVCDAPTITLALEQRVGG